MQGHAMRAVVGCGDVGDEGEEVVALETFDLECRSGVAAVYVVKQAVLYAQVRLSEHPEPAIHVLHRSGAE